MGEEKYKEFWEAFTVHSPSVQTSLPPGASSLALSTQEEWLNHFNKNLIKEQRLEITIGGKSGEELFMEMTPFEEVQLKES
jgi:hypothetical protein